MLTPDPIFSAWVPPMGPRRRFDQHEDRAIVWAYRRGWTLKRIAAQCGRHWTSVQQRVNLLIARGQLKRRALYHRPWTRQELDRLAVRWGLEPDEVLAREFGRTVDALKIAATRKLRQARSANLLSARQVGRLFGVNSKTVTHSWRARGWLAGGVKSPLGAGKNRMWHFGSDALIAFVREYSHVYDPARMDQTHWLTAHAREAWADPWVTVDEAARRLHFHPKIVRTWIHRLGFPHERQPHLGSQHGPHGGRIVLRESAIPDLARRIEEAAAANRRAGARARIAARRRPTGVLCEGCGAVELVWPQRRSCSKPCKRIVDARVAKARNARRVA